MEVRLLGAVELEIGGHATPISAAKQRGMLAMLALRANETVTADRLMEGLWGEEPPPSAQDDEHARREQRPPSAAPGPTIHSALRFTGR